MDSEKLSSWVLKSVSDKDQSYKSNDGYGDELSVKYVYDNNVANSKQLSSGDIAVIIDKEQVLGLAKISRITQEKAKKEIRRCPECQSTNYEERKTKLPKFKCNRGHEFENPDSNEVDITRFEAYYNDAFIQPYARIKTSLIRPYYSKNYNRNMSIQRIDDKFLKKYYSQEFEKLLNYPFYPEATQALNHVAESNQEYVSNGKDERHRITRDILARRGQRKFRDELIKVYGERCMVTGCSILDIVEAAHINPYRGENDHHISNGLLLRADIHTLFDLDLLGINPETLRIHLKRAVCHDGYENFSSKKLLVALNKNGPSKSALEIRWNLFLKK